MEPITRETFNKLVAHFAEYKECNTPASTMATMAIDTLGITVEPEPILPGATDGEWEKIWNGNHYSVVAKRDGKGDVTLTDWVRKEDGDVMAGSKKLVELVVMLLKGEGVRYASFKDKKAVIDQLEEIGVDVSKFRK